MITRDHWLCMPPRLEVHDEITVLRDDLLEGGSKLRFLPYLVADAKEIVFGGPFCGGAPLALSVLGREMKRKVTLFYAKRKQLHPRQARAEANGALIIEVPAGRMSVVQARAREYAARVGALFLPLGFDVPAAEEPFEGFLRESLRPALNGEPREIWCAAGSGMIARCLGRVFSKSRIKAVAVGLVSRHSAQPFTTNVELLLPAWTTGPGKLSRTLGFEQESPERAPFSACLHYEAKAWARCRREAKAGALFYNVLGETA